MLGQPSTSPRPELEPKAQGPVMVSLSNHVPLLPLKYHQIVSMNYLVIILVAQDLGDLGRFGSFDLD
jgi:hypothetical protein